MSWCGFGIISSRREEIPRVIYWDRLEAPVPESSALVKEELLFSKVYSLVRKLCQRRRTVSLNEQTARLHPFDKEKAKDSLGLQVDVLPKIPPLARNPCVFSFDEG